MECDPLMVALKFSFAIVYQEPLEMLLHNTSVTHPSKCCESAAPFRPLRTKADQVLWDWKLWDIHLLVIKTNSMGCWLRLMEFF
jgi:hypothetical protein